MKPTMETIHPRCFFLLHGAKDLQSETIIHILDGLYKKKTDGRKTGTRCTKTPPETKTKKNTPENKPFVPKRKWLPGTPNNHVLMDVW